MEQSIRDFIGNYHLGRYDTVQVPAHKEAGWQMWDFANCELLYKTKEMAQRVEAIARGIKIDPITMACAFTHTNTNGLISEQIEIIDTITKKTLYEILLLPEDRCAVFFDQKIDKPIKTGSWPQVVEWFNTL